MAALLQSGLTNGELSNAVVVAIIALIGTVLAAVAEAITKEKIREKYPSRVREGSAEKPINANEDPVQGGSAEKSAKASKRLSLTIVIGVNLTLTFLIIGLVPEIWPALSRGDPKPKSEPGTSGLEFSAAMAEKLEGTAPQDGWGIVSGLYIEQAVQPGERMIVELTSSADGLASGFYFRLRDSNGLANPEMETPGVFALSQGGWCPLVAKNVFTATKAGEARFVMQVKTGDLSGNYRLQGAMLTISVTRDR